MEVLEKNKKIELEIEHEADGNYICYHCKFIPEDIGNNKAHSVLVIANDITEVVEIREKLRESEARLRIVSDLITDYSYSFSVGDDGWLSVDWVTGAFETITGYTPEEANIKGDWISLVHPDDQKLNANRLEKLIAGEEHRVRLRIVAKDGEIHWMQDNARPISKEGRVINIIGATVDITDLKSVEEELIRKNFLLESFNYSASHDLKWPLRSLDGFSRLLEEEYSGKLDEQAQYYIDRIRVNAQHMDKLIDGLLQLSRTESKELYFTNVDLSSHARSIYKTLSESDPHRKVEFSIQDGIKAGGDSTLIWQLLENLLGNAWKFTKNVENARIEFGEKYEGNDRTFFVRDNGAGFDMKYADTLFTPFRRLHTARKYPGTGIGLSIVKSIVQRHDGKIWAESSPGKGATFYFTLKKG